MKISIITVTYNSAKTLSDTMNSVLHQTYEDIEYIVVDGGSTDGTQEIIRKYEKIFGSRMKWMSEKDEGLYDAMNKGISMAMGDVVGTLNSDDFFTSDNVIAQVASALADKRLGAVYGDIHFVRPDNLQHCVRYYSSKRFHPRWLRFGFMPAHPSLYVRKAVYDKIGPYKLDYKIGADFEMVVRMFHTHHIKAQYLPMDFVTMRTGGVSTSGIRSRQLLLREDVRGCRENGIWTNQLLVSLKFLYKIFEYKLPCLS